jgi:hypothetical protein
LLAAGRAGRAASVWGSTATVLMHLLGYINQKDMILRF